MTKPKPNVGEDVLDDVVENALLKHFDEFDEDYGFVSRIMTSLHEAGVFEALEEHVRREYEIPSLKGPGPAWKIRRILGRE